MGGGGQPWKRHNAVTSFNDINSCSHNEHTNIRQGGNTARSSNQVSSRKKLKMPSNSYMIETKKRKDEQMDERTRSVESHSSFLPSTTRVVTAKFSLKIKYQLGRYDNRNFPSGPRTVRGTQDLYLCFSRRSWDQIYFPKTATTGNYNVCASLEKTKKWYIFGRGDFTESCSYRKALMMHLFIFDVYVFRSLSKRHFVLILGPGELAGGTPILLIKLV